MQTDEVGCWQARMSILRSYGLAMLLCALAGCAAGKTHIDQAVKAEAGGSARNEGVAEQYQVHCPDVIQVNVAGRPDLVVRSAIGPDGRIELPGRGRLRVEGLNLVEVAQHFALAAEVPSSSVQAHVLEFRSQHIYLFGEGIGSPRAVPFQGPETVLDLLQRVGGITPGAAAGDVQVIRAHVTADRDPEVFRVDLAAIAVKRDQRTNLRLQPFDQVHVGQTRKAGMEKCVPPWLRPLYESLCGMRRPRKEAETRRQGDSEPWRSAPVREPSYVP
jgi:protein involved in polysaccharide export with SLBB domain